VPFTDFGRGPSLESKVLFEHPPHFLCNIHLFIFFVDSSSWPMMQYKASPTDHVWSPIDGPLIRLRKANLDSSPKLPTRVPCPILYYPIRGNGVLKLVERKEFISFRILKYVDF